MPYDDMWMVREKEAGGSFDTNSGEKLTFDDVAMSLFHQDPVAKRLLFADPVMDEMTHDSVKSMMLGELDMSMFQERNRQMSAQEQARMEGMQAQAG